MIQNSMFPKLDTIKSSSFTLSEPTAVHLGFYIYNAHPTNKQIVLQLEAGSTATTYAPYFTPIELAKIGNYQDRIYKDNGKWYIEKQVGKVVLDGTENWGTRTGGTAYAYSLSSVFDGQGSYGMSDYFRFIHNGSGSGQTIECLASASTNTNLSLFTNNASLDTVANLKTWLGTHQPSIYYSLATPTTTEITDSTLLSQLNFIANLYGGTNNIMLVGTGAQGEIGVEYTLTYEKEQVIIPETPVRLNLTDGGVINTCGCRQNVQLTMRETVQ